MTEYVCTTIKNKMIDPIDNFKIPYEWIKRAKIPFKELNKKILSGCYVLLSDGSLLRRGYTTGTTAAAAAKAAVVSLKKDITKISVPTPIGLGVILPVLAKNGKASVLKDSGDHASDVTGGMEIFAKATEYDAIVIKAGCGIGMKKGIPAINPSPMRQIQEAVQEGLVEIGLNGAHVTIYVPQGERIAKQTLNGRIGITGGISILGTTGFEEPWGEHLSEMKEKIIQSATRLVLTTGRLGLRYSHILFPDYAVILIGSDISRGLAAAKGEVIISGLPGLILKWASPDILKYSGYNTFAEMIEDNPENSLIDEALAQAVRASGKRVVLLNRDGTILRDSGDAL